jgi:ABC-type transport system involved in multi-copper enzyme maturation permease subunit
MVGPVLHQELLLGSRRNRLHVMRWIYAGWLVVQVCYFYLQFTGQEMSKAQAARAGLELGNRNPASAPNVVGAWFAEAFVSQQMILLTLAVPAFVAGAITDEKRRGTLQYLLTADLGTRHIVVGKLLGRVAQVALLAFAGAPLFCFLAGFGGVEPLTVLLVAVVLVVPLFALASMTLLASVWCRQTRDAVLGLYVVGALGWLLVWWVGGVLDTFNPLYVLAPAWGPRSTLDLEEVALRLACSILAWGLLGGACLAVAVWRLRPAYLRELESPQGRTHHWYSPARVPVNDEPVHWRERYVEGLSPTPGLRRLPQWLGVTLVAALTTLSSAGILLATYDGRVGLGELRRTALQFDLARLFPGADTGFLMQSILVMLLASLVVGIRCSGAVTGERERQTWEALLLTPLSAKQVIRGKLWGIMGASYWYLVAYAAPAILFSMVAGLVALFWTLIWLAVTFLAMYFVGAAGLWCSVLAKNSWRSLLGTLGLGYVGGTLIYLLTTPVIAILALLLLLLLSIADLILKTQMAGVAMRGFSTYFTLFFVASCIGLAFIFWLMSRLFLSWAQRHVADRERTRHWSDEPIYRRVRSPVVRHRAAPRLE